MSENSEADEETKHRRYERVIGTVTLIATLCAAGFAGGAYIQAKRQADIAQAALFESDHPFLEFSATSNADVYRGGKPYRSVAVIIKNQGTRAAVLHLAEFAIVEAETEAAAVDAMSKAGIIQLGLNCTGQVIRKIIQPAAGIRMECRSEIPKTSPKDPAFQHLVGVIEYGGGLGVRWKQTVNAIEMTGEDWIDVRPKTVIETRTDGRGRPIATERYQ